MSDVRTSQRLPGLLSQHEASLADAMHGAHSLFLQLPHGNPRPSMAGVGNYIGIFPGSLASLVSSTWGRGLYVPVRVL